MPRKKTKKKAPKRNPFWSKNYIKRPSSRRWTYRDWLIEFYDLPGTGTVQAIAYSPEIVEAFDDAYSADPKGEHYYIDHIDEGDFIAARAESQMKAAELATSGIDYNDFLENKMPSEAAADDIHAVFTTAKDAAHEVIARLGGYDSYVTRDAKRLRSEVTREAEQRYKQMDSEQRKYRGMKGQRKLTLWDFFADIQPTQTRQKWIDRAILTAQAERDSPVALDAEQVSELMRERNQSERTKMIRSFDKDNGLATNPRRKAPSKAKRAGQRRRPNAASVISRYVRG